MSSGQAVQAADTNHFFASHQVFTTNHTEVGIDQPKQVFKEITHKTDKY
jgi:hypothetical protein